MVIMVKIPAIGGGRSGSTTNKKRLSPSARTAEGMSEDHPMYQYAINEYAQTIQFGTQNDDGKGLPNATSSWSTYEEVIPPAPSGLPGMRTAPSLDSAYPPPPPPPSHTSNRTDGDTQSAHASGSSTNYSSNHPTNLTANMVKSPFEMPESTYEEYYGEAYTGQPMKYIYPSGYQSMRPRSCPWKLSIIVCLSFTWLSIFIVGHCSDQVDQSQYRNDEIDDDGLVIDIRWCGSRPLYLMWVASMLITGLSAAYCSVIGYIKVRDFAVANSRSQPPGIVDTKSDFYVQIEDGISPTQSEGSMVSYRKSIYQSDGTPQFWGAHISKPTQAAVAVTSR